MQLFTVRLDFKFWNLKQKTKSERKCKMSITKNPTPKHKLCFDLVSTLVLSSDDFLLSKFYCLNSWTLHELPVYYSMSQDQMLFVNFKNHTFKNGNTYNIYELAKDPNKNRLGKIPCVSCAHKITKPLV